MRVLYSEHGFGSDDSMNGEEVDLGEFLTWRFTVGDMTPNMIMHIELVVKLVEKTVLSLDDVQDLFGMSTSITQLRKVK